MSPPVLPRAQVFRPAHPVLEELSEEPAQPPGGAHKRAGADCRPGRRARGIAIPVQHQPCTTASRNWTRAHRGRGTPWTRPAPIAGSGFPGRGLFVRTGWSEVVELRLERGDSSELYVLLVSHLNQEGFHSRETPCDGLHDSGHDGLHASTTVSLLFRHSVHSTRGAARCSASHTVSDIEQVRRARSAWPLRHERTGAGPAPLRARPTRVNRTSKRAGLEAAFPMNAFRVETFIAVDVDTVATPRQFRRGTLDGLRQATHRPD